MYKIKILEKLTCFLLDFVINLSNFDKNLVKKINMKKRRLDYRMVSVLKFMFGLVLSISFVLLPIFVVMVIVDVAVGEGLTSSIAMLPVNFDYDITMTLLSGQEVSAVMQGGLLNLPLEQVGLGWRFIIIIQALIRYALGVCIIYILWSLFSELKASIREQENVFLQGNIKKIRLIGYVVVASAIIEFVYRNVVRYFLLDSLFIQGEKVPFTLDYGFVNDIILGFIILVIAQVYRVGTEIREEQKLTI